MDVKFKRLQEDAVLPQYAKEGDAGLDLTATSLTTERIHVFPNILHVGAYRTKAVYGTGLAVEIPTGYVGLLFPRSSIHKMDLRLANSVGVIDSGYRGEIKLIFYGNTEKVYKIGDRIGQLVIMPYPKINIIESNELSETERNEGGFGSSGG